MRVVPEATPSFAHLDRNSDREHFIEYGQWLSHRYALEDGSPVPPTRYMMDESAEQGLGPGHRVIASTIGLRGLQRALGFVMHDDISAWDTETYIENAHWLSQMHGSPDNPLPLSYEFLEQASLLHIGPFPLRVVRLFGSIDHLNDRIGFVNHATLERWTDEDWIENGRWLSHLLGSPEEPQMPTQRQLQAGAKAGLSPHLKAIIRKFGSQTNYQRALGFEPKEKLLPYDEWDRNQYVENGRWLSHLLGSPSEPRIPTNKLIIQSAELGLCPPESAILKRFGKSFTKYQDAIGFVTTHTLERWTDEDWIENGRWLSHLLGSPSEPRIPTEGEISAGSMAGIAPWPSAIKEKFGSISNYQKALGLTDGTAYKSWSRSDYIRYGHRVIAQNNGALPSSATYNDADGPSRNAILRRFGSLAQFHEIFGFEDYEHYSPEQMLAYGVNWAHEHDGQVIRKKDFMQRRREGIAGPSEKRVYTLFGDFEKYRLLIEEALPHYEQIHEQLSEIYFLPKAVLPFLLKHYRFTQEFEETTIDTARQLARLSQHDHGSVATLTELFGHGSRLTLWWDNEDFLVFAKAAFGTRNLQPEQCRDKLVLLEKLGLTPYFEDIEEAFGSLDGFIQFYLEHYQENSSDQ